jgi:hypothetical protein
MHCNRQRSWRLRPSRILALFQTHKTDATANHSIIALDESHFAGAASSLRCYRLTVRVHIAALGCRLSDQELWSTPLHEPNRPPRCVRPLPCHVLLR